MRYSDCYISYFIKGGFMPKSDNEKSSYALNKFRKKKVIYIDELAKLLDRSIPTARRRLIQWHTYTSYNYNGRYYTLHDIPRFDEHGKWKYKNILFSKHGNLKQLVIHLIKHSVAGFTMRETENIVEVSMGSFMPCFRNIPELRREKVGSQFVYFSSDEATYITQKQKRQENSTRAELTQLPTDAKAVVILVELIKYPHLSIQQLSYRLNRKGYRIKYKTIRNLFEYHGLQKKTTDMQ